MQINDMVSIGIAVIAVGIALWQTSISRAQLDEAKKTQSETEKLLGAIKLKVDNVEIISNETKRNVEEQVRRMVDKQDENIKMLLSSPKEKDQNEMLKAVLPSLIQNPANLKMLFDLAEKAKNMANN